MASPVVAATSTFGPLADSTSPTGTLPNGISAGHLLVMLLSHDGTPTVTVSGWVQLYQLTINTDSCSAWYRIADGSEGTTVAISLSSSESVSGVAMRITGAHATPGVESGTFTHPATTNSPNPPSLTATWGAEDNLFIAAYHAQNATGLLSNPAGYSSVGSVSGTGSTNTSVGCAYLQAASATEDPGTFSLGTSRSATAATIIVRPAPASSTKPMSIIAQQQALLSGGVL